MTKKRALFENNGGIYLRNIRTLSDLCKREGIQFILLTFLHDSEHMNPLQAEMIDYFNERVRDFAKAEDLPLIDLAAQFAKQEQKDSYVHEDAYHPNRRGAQFIAQELEAYFTTPAHFALLK